jgi:hypothetical protein
MVGEALPISHEFLHIQYTKGNMSITSWFKGLWGKAKNGNTYKIASFMVLGYVAATFIGSSLTRGLGLEGMPNYIANAVIIVLLTYASNFLILYFMVAKPCKLNAALLIPACIFPSIPGAIGLLRIVAELLLGIIGHVLTIVSGSAVMRAPIGSFPVSTWSLVAVLALACKGL